MQEKLKFLIIGDIVGQPGVLLFQKWIPKLKIERGFDAVIVNGENSQKSGLGIDPKIISQLRESGADVITTGNHAFDNKDVYMAFSERSDIIRPANYAAECPGKGYTIISVKDTPVAIVNIHGRVFVPDMLNCPFRTIESLLLFLKTKAKVIIVDFHAEATSEKKVMGLFLDGKVSCMFGTHTHVPTADDVILPGGTGYITDVGCSGSLHSVIGFDYEQIIKRFLTHYKLVKMKVDTKPPFALRGIVLTVSTQTGKALSLERIEVIDNDLQVSST